MIIGEHINFDSICQNCVQGALCRATATFLQTIQVKRGVLRVFKNDVIK